MDLVKTFRSTDHARQWRFFGPIQWSIPIAIFVVGCGQGSGTVAHLQGQVTLNGKPLPNDATAFIVFTSDLKPAESVSVPVVNSRYDSPSTPQGAVKAFFEINRPVGAPKKSERTGQMYQNVKSLVPAKYATGLPLEVKGDDSNRDFQLTD
jgi:hypothetical protein